MNAFSRIQVEKQISSVFGASSINGVMKLLDQVPLDDSPSAQSGRARIQLAILKLSKGDISQLKHYVEQALKDYRDVLYWAECF